MKKNYQTSAAPAATEQLVLPDTVTLAMADLAEAVKEGLLALAVGAGFGVMEVMMQESVTGLCGAKGVHDPDRTAVRHGSEDGSVTLGGRRAGPVLHEAEQEPEGVAIGDHRAGARLALLGHPLGEEQLQGGRH